MTRRRKPHWRRVIRVITETWHGETWTTGRELDCHHVEPLIRRRRGVSRLERRYMPCSTCSGTGKRVTVRMDHGGNRLEGNGGTDHYPPGLDVRAAVRAAHEDPHLFDALQGFCAVAVGALQERKFERWMPDIQDSLERLAGRAGLLAPPAPEEDP